MVAQLTSAAAIRSDGKKTRVWSGWCACAAYVLSGALPAAAADFLGPGKCTSCHDHARQTRKWRLEEPAAQAGRAHVNARKQLDLPAAARYAGAVGLKDPYDGKGDCVRCHATTFRGNANAGVSCESCHGAASGYLVLHQTEGAYAQAVAAGMRDLRRGPTPIAELCADCHLVPDARLSAAGHPNGRDFDAGAALQRITHWTGQYDAARVAAEVRTLAVRRLARAAAPSTRPAPPSAADDVPAQGSSSSPIIDALLASIAEDTAIAPLGADLSAAIQRPPLRPPADSRAQAELPSPLADAPRSPEASATYLRGRAARLLEQLLRSGIRIPSLPQPQRPREFAGRDGELLRLQDEVIVLALEALRREKP